MSIHFDASRDRFVVRWKEDGRRRVRRFPSEADAIAFDASLRRPLRPTPTAASIPSAAAGDGIYAYGTRAGTRFRFVFRQSDGTLSTRRGFTSRRAAATARRRLVESIERGEVKVARETFETFRLRLLEEKRPYMTKGSAEDFQAHGRKRLLPSLGPVPLARVDEQLVRRWMDEMVALVEFGELAPKTVNNARELPVGRAQRSPAPRAAEPQPLHRRAGTAGRPRRTGVPPTRRDRALPRRLRPALPPPRVVPDRYGRPDSLRRSTCASATSTSNRASFASTASKAAAVMPHSRRRANASAPCSDMPLHALRHTAAAAWLTTGHPLISVQRQLGHRSITTTEEHYGHLVSSFIREAAFQTERVIAAARPGQAPRVSGRASA